MNSDDFSVDQQAGFLADFEETMRSVSSSDPSRRTVSDFDPDREYLKKPAPNAIQWAVGEHYLNMPSLYEYKRSYQIIRDVFQLRCPLCNPGRTPDESPVTVNQLAGLPSDSMSQDEAVLRNEILLEWSEDTGEDTCPKCKSTRSQLQDDGLIKRINQMHLVCGMRCQPLTNLVFTSEGLVELGELHAGTTVSTEHGPSKVDETAVLGVKDTKVIQTQQGWDFEVGAEHLMRVLRPDLSRDWVRADELQLGDTLMLNVGADVWGTGDLTPQEAYVIGHLIADGDVTDTYRARAFHDTEEFATMFAQRVAGLTVASTPNIARSNTAWVTEISKKSFVDWLRSQGVSPQTATTKEMPAAIRRAPRASVCAALRGYFDGDGFACVTQGRAQVGFDTVSAELAKHVRLLLLNLGIQTRMHTRPTRGFRSVGLTGTTTHHVVILPESLQRFSDCVGFDHPQRALKLEECLAVSAQCRAKSGPQGSALVMREWLRELNLATGATVDARGHVRGGGATAVAGAAMDKLTPQFYQGHRALTLDTAALLHEQLSALPEATATDTYADLGRFLDPAWAYVQVTALDDSEAELGDLSVPGPESYVAEGFLGHNSGKSVTAGAYIGTYIEHRLITLALSHPKGLHGYLGLTLKDPFEMTFLASNDTQSLDTIWAKYIAARKASPWFHRYREWVSTRAKNQCAPQGMRPWEYKELGSQIINESPEMGKLIINSLNSNSDGLVGRTRVAGFVDEIGRMKQGDGSQSADEIYRGIENSLQTVRSRTRRVDGLPWLGMMCSVTSPKALHDKSMTLLRASGKIDEMIAYHYATWDFNPFEPRENFNSAYAKDPVGAERDFGARPPAAAYPLIHDRPRFRTMVTGHPVEPIASFTKETFEDQLGQRYVRVNVDRADMKFDYPRYICFDAGLKFDAFAATCAHGEPVVDETGAQRIVTVTDWVLRVLPDEGQEVYFDFVIDMIDKLRKKTRIARIEFDRWNSLQLIQQIRNKFQIFSEQSSTKDEDYRKFRSEAYQGLVRMLPYNLDDVDEVTQDWQTPPPLMCAESSAVYEIEGLEEDPTTGKVTNPRKGERRGWNSNDTAQVIVHAHKMVQTAGYTKKHDDRSRRGGRHRLESNMAQWANNRQGSVVNPSAGRHGPRNWNGGGRGW